MRLGHFLIVESNSNHHTKREIPQCINCQSYGHTKSFCFRRAKCVKCAGDYPTINYHAERNPRTLNARVIIQSITKGAWFTRVYEGISFQLRRKVITSESQLRTEPANTQNRHVQPGRSYVSVARTGNKQSNTSQNRQETQGKTTTSSPDQFITSIIQKLQNMTKEYMEKMGAMFKPSNAYHQDNVMDKLLKIVTWNANGLAKHTQEIKTFIFNQNIDIYLYQKHT